MIVQSTCRIPSLRQEGGIYYSYTYCRVANIDEKEYLPVHSPPTLPSSRLFPPFLYYPPPLTPTFSPFIDFANEHVAIICMENCTKHRTSALTLTLFVEYYHRRSRGGMFLYRSQSVYVHMEKMFIHNKGPQMRQKVGR